jgi:hypothetical protein
MEDMVFRSVEQHDGWICPSAALRGDAMSEVVPG